MAEDDQKSGEKSEKKRDIAKDLKSNEIGEKQEKSIEDQLKETEDKLLRSKMLLNLDLLILQKKAWQF